MSLNTTLHVLPHQHIPLEPLNAPLEVRNKCHRIASYFILEFEDFSGKFLPVAELDQLRATSK
jgi:hypothetical protein